MPYKIKDNVNLKELYKYGFKKYENTNEYYRKNNNTTDEYSTFFERIEINENDRIIRTILYNDLSDQTWEGTIERNTRIYDLDRAGIIEFIALKDEINKIDKINKPVIFIPEEKINKLEEKILDLKKENLLLLQQNINKDEQIEELEKEAKKMMQIHKEDICKNTSNIKDICRRKICLKIVNLESNKGLLNTKEINFAIKILEKLKEEI